MLPLPATPMSPLLISACVSSHAPLFGIEAQADGDAIENQRRFVVDSGQHDGAATETQLPVGNTVVGRFKMGQQRNPVRPGNDLERSHQHAPSGIPFDAHFRRVDRHRIVRRIAVDDVAGAGADLAAEIGRQAVPAQFTLQFAGEQQIRAVGQILEPQRQQDICRRHLVGANIHRSHAIRGGPDRHAKRPGMAALLAEAQRYATAAGSTKAEGDVLEIPFIAALLIINDQVAVLQTDFVEILPVEPGQAQAVEPVKASQQPARRVPAVGSRWRRRGARLGA